MKVQLEDYQALYALVANEYESFNHFVNECKTSYKLYLNGIGDKEPKSYFDWINGQTLYLQHLR